MLVSGSSKQEENQISPNICSITKLQSPELSNKNVHQINSRKSECIFKQFHKRLWVIETENEIFYTEQEIKQNENNSDIADYMNGVGFHYKVLFDENANPTFFLYNGNFSNGIRNGKGTSYQGKSRNIDYSGEWKNGTKVTKTEENQQQNVNVKQAMQQGKSKIIIRENGKVIQSQSPQIYQQPRTWINFNEQISEIDIKVLSSSNQMFTSSIIDAFVSYLMLENNKFYFQQSNPNRNNFARILILPSFLLTNMSNNNSETNRQIFETYLLQYERINFELFFLFNSIYFVVNQDYHWYLIKLNENFEMEIFDSIKHQFTYYHQKLKIIISVLNISRDIKAKINNSNLQNNGYDCGAFVCLNLYYESPLHRTINLKSPLDIRRFLLQLLQENHK